MSAHPMASIPAQVTTTINSIVGPAMGSSPRRKRVRRWNTHQVPRMSERLRTPRAPWWKRASKTSRSASTMIATPASVEMTVATGDITAGEYCRGGEAWTTACAPGQGTKLVAQPRDEVGYVARRDLRDRPPEALIEERVGVSAKV